MNRPSNPRYSAILVVRLLIDSDNLTNGRAGVVSFEKNIRAGHTEQWRTLVIRQALNMSRKQRRRYISNPTAVKVSDKEDDEIILRRPATLVRLNVLPRMVI